MEHEVFVPVPAERLREVLADPARVAGAVPGLQRDAGAGPVAGRLKVRVGSHSVTYRGAVRVSPRDDGTYAVEGDGTETRGAGTVTLALTLRLADAEGGTAVAFTGTATATGRLTEFPAEAVTAAGTRLLTRFAESLGTAADPAQDPAPTDSTDAADAADAADSTDAADAADAADGTDATDGADAAGAAEPPAPVEPTAPAEPPAPAEPTAPAEAATVFDTDVPPPALDPAAAPDADPDPASTPATAPADEEPPAEAAHARRTMIGRSAEEVDHAPPRGRYAPVPAPQAAAAPTPLRWAAPAAALVVASAIVVGRALRRRH